MKKLLIAAALTASVCSFGTEAVTPINAQTFDGEGYALATDGYITKADGDASAVTAYGGEDTLAASDKTTEAGAAGANYLNLSTEGSTLWRKINTDGSNYGAAATGTYIDTLVQFTATEEDPTSIDTGAKLAMWLLKSGEDDAPTYTLKVMGAAITKPGEDAGDVYVVASTNNFALNTTVNPGTWYRLTVKAIPVLDYESSGVPFTGFAIYIDGVLASPVNSAFAADWVAAMSEYITVDSTVLNSLIPSVNAGSDGDQLLYGVGFKGTGAIDSIAWTDKNIYPFSDPSPAFTLTIAFGDGVSAVDYTIGEAEPVTVEKPAAEPYEVVVTLDAAATVKVAANAIADWFKMPAEQEVTLDADNAAQKVTVTAESIGASDVGVTVPEGSTVAANTVFEWAKAIDGATPNSIKNAANIFNNYLLNVTDLTVDPQIKIVSIDLSGAAPVVTAEVTDANGTTLKTLDADDIKGALKYKAAATLEALKNATPKEAIGAGDQFIQVVVE
jgi:hypothetical protein